MILLCFLSHKPWFLVESLAYSRQLKDIYWVTECIDSQCLNHVILGVTPTRNSTSVLLSHYAQIRLPFYSVQLCQWLYILETLCLGLWKNIHQESYSGKARGKMKKSIWVRMKKIKRNIPLIFIFLSIIFSIFLTSTKNTYDKVRKIRRLHVTRVKHFYFYLVISNIIT